MLRSPPGSTLSLSRPMSVASGSDLYGRGGRTAFGSSSQAPPALPAPLGLGDPWIMAQHMAAQQSMAESAADQHYMEAAAAAAAAGGGVRAAEVDDVPRMGGSLLSDPYQRMGGSLQADTYQMSLGLPPPALSPPAQQQWERGHTFPPTPAVTPEYGGSGAASDRSGPSRLLQQQQVHPPPALDTVLVLQHAAVAALVAASEEAGVGSASALVSSLSFDLPVTAAAAAPLRAGSLLAPRPAEELQQYNVQHGVEQYNVQHSVEQYKAPPLAAPAFQGAVVAPSLPAPAPAPVIPAPEVDGVLSDAAQMDQVPERQSAEGFNFAPPSSRASVAGGSGGGAVTSGGGEARVSVMAAGDASTAPPPPAATPSLPFGLVMVSSFKPEAEAPVPEPAKAVVVVVPEEPAVQPRGYVRQPNAADIQEAMQAKLRVLREAQQQRLEAQQQAEEEER